MIAQQGFELSYIRVTEFFFIEQAMKEIHRNAILFLENKKCLKVTLSREESPGRDILEAGLTQIRMKIQLENNVLFSF